MSRRRLNLIDLISSILLSVSLLTGVAGGSVTQQARDALRHCRLTLQRPCPDNLHIKFHLFTRRNPAASQLVQVTSVRDNLHKTFFNAARPNKVIIHGLSPRLYKTELQAVKDAYLAKEDVNVWMVDWSRLAYGGACVVFSVRNVNHVARCTAQLVTAIARRAPDTSVHVVADRLGVRVAHVVAGEVKPLRLARVTGLNPEGAGGVMMTGVDENRFGPSDAEFVDTIHTTPFLPKTGMFGHIDFYVNPNRLHQPGCETQISGKFTCDHSRALQYFAESIVTQTGFLAWECASYANFALGTCNPQPPPLAMGEFCPKGSSGIYIVYTARERPYALGHWTGSRYQQQGPKMRTDAVSRYSTKIKRKMELLEENTPEIVKEMGIVDQLKSGLDNKTDNLKATAVDIGLKGLKVLATHILEKHLKINENHVENAKNVTKPVGENK